MAFLSLIKVRLLEYDLSPRSKVAYTFSGIFPVVKSESILILISVSGSTVADSYFNSNAIVPVGGAVGATPMFCVEAYNAAPIATEVI